MKPQDVIFIILFGMLLVARKPHLFVYAGLGSLVLAIPLFATWVFFTAQRLTWYAAAFFGMFILIELFAKRKATE